MTKKGNSGCCPRTTGCSGNEEVIKIKKNKLTIDFLYLDLSVCTRCQGTENNLDEALDEVTNILEATGTDVQVNKINVNTKELATTYKFLSSPTIRVNGRDLQMEFKESLCESCGDLLGDEVDCRVWRYQGKDYTVPPKAMVIEGILKAVYGENLNSNIAEQEYDMPENLKHFYDVKESKK